MPVIQIPESELLTVTDEIVVSHNFLKQYPLFFILKRTLGMGVPREIYPKKDMPCVMFFDEDVYLFAPRIDND